MHLVKLQTSGLEIIHETAFTKLEVLDCDVYAWRRMDPGINGFKDEIPFQVRTDDPVFRMGKFPQDLDV